MLITLLVAMMRELEINEISLNQFDRPFPLKTKHCFAMVEFHSLKALLSKMGLEGKVSVNEVKDKIHLTK